MKRHGVSLKHAKVRGASWPVYRRLLGYSAKYWPLLLVAVPAMALDAACTAGFSTLFQPLLDDGFMAGDPEIIQRLPVYIILIFVGRGLGHLIADWAMAGVGRSVIRDLRSQLFAKYMVLPVRYFDRAAKGQLISRLTYNVEQVAEAATNAITVLVKDSFYVLGFLAVMFYHSPRLTLATMVIGPFIALIILVVSRRFRRLSRKIQDSMGDVTQRADEITRGNRVVRVYGAQDLEQDRFEDINQDNRKQHLKLVVSKSGSAALIQLIAGVALAIIVYLATSGIWVKEMSPGEFTAFMTAMLAILPSLKKLTNLSAMIQKGVAAADTVFTTLDSDAEEGGQTRLDAAKGEIEIKKVDFAYPDGDKVLREISFTMAPGSITALVGRSGSGKSSLISLLPRFYSVNAGEILLDGINLNQYRLADLRSQIALVSQEIVLFDDTIANNIAYGAMRGTDLEQVREAARQANALEFIEKLPEGFDTLLGENGVQLSGGQSQRIAIARAILKNAPILVLDEATSALDTESERAIQDALEKVMRERTTIVIAHRLSTVENADQIIVLEQGQVVEVGAHKELLELDGHYAELHKLQFRSDQSLAGDGRRTHAPMVDHASKA